MPSAQSPAPPVSPARKAVLKALERTSSAPWLDEASTPDVREFAKLPPQDRAFAERMRRGVLQNLRLLDFLIDQPQLFERDRTAERLVWLLRMAAYQRMFMGGVPDYAIGQQTVLMARMREGEKAGKFVNAVLRKLLAFLPDSPDGLEARILRIAQTASRRLTPAVRHSVPDAIVKVLAQGYGVRAMQGILRSVNEDETRVWLRVNTLKTKPSSLAKALAKEGVRTEPGPEGSGVLRWLPKDPANTRKPWETAPWGRGELTVQDLAATLPVRMLAPKPGETIVDACAAPGGKTGQVWEAMEGKGRLIALEPHEARWNVLRESLVRLYGPDHPILVRREWAQLERLGEVPERIDAVVLDAPCLGFGLIRRHPEIRWDDRLRRQRSVRQQQSAILDQYAQRLSPGGRLVWATCSPTVGENEMVVLPWLKRNRDFEAVPPGPLIPEEFKPWVQTRDIFARTRPDLGPVDGFAVAVLRRKEK